jgi:hypothetical protein
MQKSRSQGVKESGVAATLTPGAEIAQAKACPTFTLVAGRPGHLRALVAAAPWLAEQLDWHVIREFELWEDKHPCR